MSKSKAQNKLQTPMLNIKTERFVIWYLCFGIILNFVFCRLSFAEEHLPRYISLAPSTTEILFALGLDKEIIGVSSYCNYPYEVLKKEKVGTFSQPNIEKILFLQPDYIFCTGLEQAQAIMQLKWLRLKVYVADPKNVEELLKSIYEIGRITQKEKEADELVKKLKQEIDEVKSKVKLTLKDAWPKVFIEIWHNPLTTAGKGSFVDELITIAGGVNIAYDAKRPYSIFSAEEVISRNPDYIILAYMDKKTPLELVKGRVGWSEVSAVKNNRVYNDINPDLLLRPGPRIGEAIKKIFNKIHSDE